MPDRNARAREIAEAKTRAALSEVEFIMPSPIKNTPPRDPIVFALDEKTEPVVLHGPADVDEALARAAALGQAYVIDHRGLAARLHEDGQAHAPEDCDLCQQVDRERRRAEFLEGVDQFSQAVRRLAVALTEAFESAFPTSPTAAPKRPTTGPPVRRSKNPKHH